MKPGTPRIGAGPVPPVPKAFSHLVADAAKPVFKAFSQQRGSSSLSHSELPDNIWHAFVQWRRDERTRELALTPPRFLEQLEELYAAVRNRRRPRSLPYSFAVADALLGYYPVATARLAYRDGDDSVHVGYDWQDPRPCGEDGPFGGGEELRIVWERPDRRGRFLERVTYPNLHVAAVHLFDLRPGGLLEVMPDIPAMIESALAVEVRAECLELFLQLVIERARWTLRVDCQNTGSMLVQRRLQPPPIWQLWRQIAFQLWPNWRILPERKTGTILKAAVQECIEAFRTAGGETAQNAERFELPHDYDRKLHNEICRLLHHKVIANDVERLLRFDAFQDRANALLGDVELWKSEIAMRLDVGVYSVANAALSRWPVRRTLPSLDLKTIREIGPRSLIDHVEEALRHWSLQEGERARREVGETKIS